MIALLVCFSLMSLTACETVNYYDINIPKSAFVCADEPEKPAKQGIDPITGKPTYTESATGKYLNGWKYAYRDCKQKLGEAEETYLRQKSMKVEK